MHAQAAIMEEAELGASRRVFDLQLDQLGPYSLAFNRSGRRLLLGGRKGHIALLDWQQARPLAEVQVGISWHIWLSFQCAGLPSGCAAVFMTTVLSIPLCYAAGQGDNPRCQFSAQ